MHSTSVGSVKLNGYKLTGKLSSKLVLVERSNPTYNSVQLQESKLCMAGTQIHVYMYIVTGTCEHGFTQMVPRPAYLAEDEKSNSRITKLIRHTCSRTRFKKEPPIWSMRILTRDATARPDATANNNASIARFAHEEICKSANADMHFGIIEHLGKKLKQIEFKKKKWQISNIIEFKILRNKFSETLRKIPLLWKT